VADDPGKKQVPAKWPSPELHDVAEVAASGTRAVAVDRILATKRIFPVIPAQKTVVFTG
jgi:hypothetical protein